MELINSSRRAEHLPAKASEACRPVPAHLSGLMARYDGPEGFTQSFGAVTRQQTYSDIELAIRRDVPTLIAAMTVFGSDTVRAVLEVHILDVAWIINGKDAKDFEASLTSELMLENRNGRMLTMASVLQFFRKLRCGEIRIYGQLTPHKLVTAFSDYAVETRQREIEIIDLLERRRLREEAMGDNIEFATDAEGRRLTFCESMGVPQLTPWEYFLYMRKNGGEPDARKWTIRP